MILGSPYYRLVAMDGLALPQWQQGREQQKLAEALIQRRNESVSERAERIAKYEKERERDHLLMDQLTKAMNFVLVREQELNGRQVYVLNARGLLLQGLFCCYRVISCGDTTKLCPRRICIS